MRQRPTPESLQSSPTQSLHPTLQAALSNLDVQLEEELARYRRQRNGRSVVVSRGFKRQRKSLDLISVGATNQSSTAAVASPHIDSIAQQKASADRPSADRSEMPHSPVAPSLQAQAAVASAIPVSHGYQSAPPAPPVKEGPVRQENAWSSSVSALASQLAIADEPDTAELAADPWASPNLSPSPDELTHTQLHPDDYLESSEELLRSLAEEEAETQVERGFIESLMTPLGVGSMLLLLLSSATFGYVIMNPTSLSRLGAGQLFANQASSPASSTSTASSGSNDATNNNSPNLASQEFPDLSLKNLGTLSAGSGSNSLPLVSPTAIAKANGTVGNGATPPTVRPVLPTVAKANPSSGTPGVEVRVAPAPAPAQASQPIERSPQLYSPPVRHSEPPPVSIPRTPVAPPTATVSVPSAPAPSPTRSTSSSDYRYKVVVEYNGDRALEQARQAAPDAYVRNFPDGGARIQLGAYGSAEEAQRRIQQLQQQGIPAQVYKP